VPPSGQPARPQRPWGGAAHAPLYFACPGFRHSLAAAGCVDANVEGTVSEGCSGGPGDTDPAVGLPVMAAGAGAVVAGALVYPRKGQVSGQQATPKASVPAQGALAPRAGSLGPDAIATVLRLAKGGERPLGAVALASSPAWSRLRARSEARGESLSAPPSALLALANEGWLRKVEAPAAASQQLSYTITDKGRLALRQSQLARDRELRAQREGEGESYSVVELASGRPLLHVAPLRAEARVLWISFELEGDALDDAEAARAVFTALLFALLGDVYRDRVDHVRFTNGRTQATYTLPYDAPE
jgi:hypothetical protein